MFELSAKIHVIEMESEILIELNSVLDQSSFLCRQQNPVQQLALLHHRTVHCQLARKSSPVPNNAAEIRRVIPCELVIYCVPCRLFIDAPPISGQPKQTKLLKTQKQFVNPIIINNRNVVVYK